MSVQIPVPVLIGLTDWADQVVFAIDQFGPAQRLDNEDEWQDWAAMIFGNPSIATSLTPNPYEFSDWREWASALIQSLQ